MRTISTAALLAAAGCRDSTAPELPTRLLPHYALVTYGGEPLPVVLHVMFSVPGTPGGTGYSCEDRLTAMTLDFVAEGARYTATTHELLVCDDGRPDVASLTTESGTYWVDAGGDLHLDASVTEPGSTRHSLARIGWGEVEVFRQETSYPPAATVTDARLLLFRERR